MINIRICGPDDSLADDLLLIGGEEKIDVHISYFDMKWKVGTTHGTHGTHLVFFVSFYIYLTFHLYDV